MDQVFCSIGFVHLLVDLAPIQSTGVIESGRSGTAIMRVVIETAAIPLFNRWLPPDVNPRRALRGIWQDGWAR